MCRGIGRHDGDDGDNTEDTLPDGADESDGR